MHIAETVATVALACKVAAGIVCFPFVFVAVQAVGYVADLV